MSSINQADFCIVCYLVLMDHHGAGYIEAHPSYLREKIKMIGEGFAAFGHLDHLNQAKVIEYLKHWKYDIPPELNKGGYEYPPETQKVG